MRLSFRTLLILPLALAAFLWGAAPQGVSAAANCEFGSQFKALAAAQKNSGSGRTEDFLAELALRKGLIANILDCSGAEAKKLQASTKEIPEGDAGIRSLKKQHLGKLQEALDYYAIQRGRVSDLGFQGSKDMARTVLLWRSGNYAPLAGSIGNLLLWIKNQDLFPIAENRLAQIQKSLEGLDLDKLEGVDELLADARRNLDAAKAANIETKQALLERTVPEAAAAILRNSLDALALTYKNFFDISETVKKVVPL